MASKSAPQIHGYNKAAYLHGYGHMGALRSAADHSRSGKFMRAMPLFSVRSFEFYEKDRRFAAYQASGTQRYEGGTHPVISPIIARGRTTRMRSCYEHL